MERESCVIFLKENNTGNYCLHDKEIAQETNLTEKLHIGCKIFLYFFFQNCQSSRKVYFGVKIRNDLHFSVTLTGKISYGHTYFHTGSYELNKYFLVRMHRVTLRST